MAFLTGKEWNVIAITIERPTLYRINGNHAKGRNATTVRDNAKMHVRTVYWGVFDAKGKLLESGPGPAARNIPARIIEKLGNDFERNASVQEALEVLVKRDAEKSAKKLVWDGYPSEERPSYAGEYKLSARAEGEGAQFEAQLKLFERDGTLMGSLVGPDGEELPLSDVHVINNNLGFYFILDDGTERARMDFKGRLRKDSVLGTLVAHEPTRRAAAAAREAAAAASATQAAAPQAPVQPQPAAPQQPSAAPQQPAAPVSSTPATPAAPQQTPAQAPAAAPTKSNGAAKKDLTGEYRLVVPAADGDFEARLRLKQRGMAFTGTVISPSGDELPIKYTKCVDQNITFHIIFDPDGAQVPMEFVGRIENDTVIGKLIQ